MGTGRVGMRYSSIRLATNINPKNILNAKINDSFSNSAKKLAPEDGLLPIK